jgi:hypothetical protein
MSAKIVRKAAGHYAIEADGEEVGAIVRYQEPGVRHWDVLWDNRPEADGAPNWHKYLTGCRRLAEAKQLAAVFIDRIRTREWMPVRDGAEPAALRRASRTPAQRSSGERPN